MFRDQMVNFLVAAVVFLLLTNVLMAVVTLAVLRLLPPADGETLPPAAPILRKLERVIRSKP